jgi:predicted DNA-binding mobile mystery protein A
MKNEFSNQRLNNLEDALESLREAGSIPRPERGWIHAMREASGVSTGELGRRLGTSRQLPLQFEKAETDDSITLKSLRRVGEALDCELVYALVPRAATKQKSSEKRAGIHAFKGKSSARPSRNPRSQNRDLGHPVSMPVAESDNAYFCD